MYAWLIPVKHFFFFYLSGPSVLFLIGGGLEAVKDDLADPSAPSRDLFLLLAAARLSACCCFCCCSADSFLVTAYLKSNSPLFSIVNEADLREWTTIEPKLMSLIGEMKNREKTALALIRMGMFAITSPWSPTCVSITYKYTYYKFAKINVF